jgi:hypothetical protein
LAKKNKKGNLGPKRKRMSRSSRLQSLKVKEWVNNYNGKNIIKSYSKWYGVDLICAMKELELLGYSILEGTKEKTRKAVRDRAYQKKLKEKRKQKKEMLLDVFESDETFAFIVGYTAGGAPYGVTHEEMEELENHEEIHKMHRFEDDSVCEDKWLEAEWNDSCEDVGCELTNEEINELLLYIDDHFILDADAKSVLKRENSRNQAALKKVLYIENDEIPF